MLRRHACEPVLRVLLPYRRNKQTSGRPVQWAAAVVVLPPGGRLGARTHAAGCMHRAIRVLTVIEANNSNCDLLRESPSYQPAPRLYLPPSLPPNASRRHPLARTSQLFPSNRKHSH
ncbi:hypothetical protein E2C01_062530 [Portunus trituberculatus]|uniref:Uncharacterized protein n=1 Tax=Portunus trituberculatus TaxID=210409 RepID=A0A5B7H844_PORTR|nr:hypothetical protein [Portunus trituberculatus]